MNPQTRWAVDQIQQFLRKGNAAAVVEIGEHLVVHEIEDLETYLFAAFCLGLGYEQLGLFDKALAQFRECLTIDPATPAALAARGRVLFKMGRNGEAAALFEDLARRHPDRADFRQAAGSALLRLGRIDPALACLRRAHELDPANAHILNDLGSALLLAGDLQGALDAFRRAVERITPDRLNLAREIRDSIEEVRAALALQGGLAARPPARVIDLQEGRVAEAGSSVAENERPAAQGASRESPPAAPASNLHEAGESVRARILEALRARACRPRQIIAALHLWADYLDALPAGERGGDRSAIDRAPLPWSAAVVYTIGRLDAEPWGNQAAVARAFGVSTRALSRSFGRLRQSLSLEIGDPRYTTAPCPRRERLMDLVHDQRIEPDKLLL
jgi:tetratricopeptide (TPR) repeat protein